MLFRNAGFKYRPLIPAGSWRAFVAWARSVGGERLALGWTVGRISVDDAYERPERLLMLAAAMNVPRCAL
jgi:hypothetical protein